VAIRLRYREPLGTGEHPGLTIPRWLTRTREANPFPLKVAHKRDPTSRTISTQVPCMAPLIANVARFILFIGTAVASVRATLCENPSVRKEWRALSTDERAQWIEAIKVRFYSLVFSCFNSIPIPVPGETTPRSQPSRNETDECVARAVTTHTNKKEVRFAYSSPEQNSTLVVIRNPSDITREQSMSAFGFTFEVYSNRFQGPNMTHPKASRLSVNHLLNRGTRYIATDSPAWHYP